jgi:hypothetical protein
MTFTLHFKLRQHTPLLHFQHDQPDATLRATEVKPKLDRFIIDQIGLHKNWLVGTGEHNALDYKIKFSPKNYIKSAELPFTPKKNEKTGIVKQVTIPEMYPMVLANMGGKDTTKELKNFRLYETIDVEIFSFHEDLLEKIKTNIALFFALHNFGNRQTKGFGGYYLDQSDPLFVAPEHLLKNQFDGLVFWNFKENTPHKDIFSNIDILYKILKSGFNFPDHPKDEKGKMILDKKQEFTTYQPSFLKNYFLEHYKIGSEKRAIKESLFKPDLHIQPDKTLVANNYVRAILGTSDAFEYRDNRWGKVVVKGEEVDRFQSSITFKVFSNMVFIIPNDWSAIKGKMFTFKEGGKETKPIPAPTVDFDLARFIISFSAWFNGIKTAEVERLNNVIAEQQNRRPIPAPIKPYLQCLKNVELKTLQK